MDNKIFNVNGGSIEMLQKALELSFLQDGENTVAKAWRFIPEKGFVLYWHKNAVDAIQAFPCELSAEAVTPMVWEWLKGEQAKSMKFEHWDADADHDGSNSRGWRVYVEDWGYVANDTAVICAIRPVYLWHGK